MPKSVLFIFSKISSDRFKILFHTKNGGGLLYKPEGGLRVNTILKPRYKLGQVFVKRISSPSISKYFVFYILLKGEKKTLKNATQSFFFLKKFIKRLMAFQQHDYASWLSSLACSIRKYRRYCMTQSVWQMLYVLLESAVYYVSAVTVLVKRIVELRKGRLSLLNVFSYFTSDFLPFWSLPL